MTAAIDHAHASVFRNLDYRRFVIAADGAGRLFVAMRRTKTGLVFEALGALQDNGDVEIIEPTCLKCPNLVPDNLHGFLCRTCRDKENVGKRRRWHARKQPCTTESSSTRS